MILFREDTKTFFLNTENSSYVIKILKDNMLCHWYYGASLGDDNLDSLNLFAKHEYMHSEEIGKWVVSNDTAPFECPVFGNGDFRTPSILLENEYGQRTANLVFKSFRISKEKEEIKGLPSFNTNTLNVDTLEIVLKDTVSNFEVSLIYSVFEKEDAITRRCVIHNISESSLKLLSAQSLSIDFQAQNFDLITLDGAWARERHVNRRPLTTGTASIESRRGATGHQHNPFCALVAPDTNETNGIAYGFSLVYSGNFKISADVDQFGSTRLQAGINPFNFCYKLNPGDSFETPEAVLVFSQNGLNGMSQCFHDMCRNHLGKSSEKIARPIVINSWEAMYFDMSEQAIEAFVSNCKDLGIDTFVLDDGWFGKRNNDHTSLGDWFIDEAKFPNGFDPIVKVCKQNGMKFGLWIEPEMISRKSRLFEEHPDWCIHVENKEPTESRQQLVLDMSHPEIVDYIYEKIADILGKYGISYVKWDMNRNITDVGSATLSPDQHGEFNHRYILGVYELMRRLTTNFPKIIFEGCAGGGGRFDFGVLYYMPQIWTSDDTDAIERLKIQYGTSMVYPLSAMTAHVSACPNHQTGRTTYFKTRGDVAQICNFGYELDIAKLGRSEKIQIKEQIALHKRLENMIASGSFYRIDSPFKNDFCSWEIVSNNKKSAFVMFASQKITPNIAGHYIKLQGLLPDKIYRVSPLSIRLSGKTLMNFGLPITGIHDFETLTFELKAE